MSSGKPSEPILPSGCHWRIPVRICPEGAIAGLQGTNVHTVADGRSCRSPPASRRTKGLWRIMYEGPRRAPCLPLLPASIGSRGRRDTAEEEEEEEAEKRSLTRVSQVRRRRGKEGGQGIPHRSHLICSSLLPDKQVKESHVLFSFFHCSRIRLSFSSSSA